MRKSLIDNYKHDGRSQKSVASCKGSHPDDVREKIKTSQLVNRLNKHAKGKINGQTQNALPSRLRPGKNPSESAYQSAAKSCPGLAQARIDHQPSPRH